MDAVLKWDAVVIEREKHYLICTDVFGIVFDNHVVVVGYRSSVCLAVRVKEVSGVHQAFLLKLRRRCAV